MIWRRAGDENRGPGTGGRTSPGSGFDAEAYLRRQGPTAAGSDTGGVAPRQDDTYIAASENSYLLIKY